MWQKSIRYSANVWLRAILVSPLFWFTVEMTLKNRWQYVLGYFGWYLLVVLWGAIISLPALGLFSLANWWLVLATQKSTQIRIYSLLFAAAIIWGTFALLLGYDGRVTWLKDSLSISLYYTAGSLVGVLLTKA
jgi:hypothetical protein